MRFGSIWMSLTAMALCVTTGSALPGGLIDGKPLTNAARMAEGKAPLKPSRLFSPTRPRAISPVGSSNPVPPGSLQIAAGTTGSPTRKRDATTPPGTFGVLPDGTIAYTTSYSQSAVFQFVDGSKTSLQWTATSTSGSFVQGQAYPVYALASGGLYRVLVGTPPAGAVTSIFTAPRYTGDLSPVLPVPGGSTAQQLLWTVNAQTNAVLLSPDLATASAATGGQAAVLLVQYYDFGSTPSISAAQAYAATGAAMVNPLQLYMRTATGYLNGYINNLYGSLYPGPTQAGTGTTFYAPTLGNGGPAQLYSRQSGYQNPGTQSPLYALVGTSRGTGAFGISPTETTNGASLPNILGFNVPTSMSGILQASTADASNLQIYANQGGRPFYYACASAAACAAIGASLSVCLEAAPVTGAAYLCDQQAVQAFKNRYTGKSALYMYDPAAPAGPLTGYVGLGANGLLMTSDAYVYRDISESGSQVQHLAGLQGNAIWYTFAIQNGFWRSNFGADYSYPSGTPAFNLPADPSVGGLITVRPSATSGSSATSMPFFAGTTSSGYSYIYACSNVASCPNSQAALHSVCMEIVPEGGTPGACAAAAASGQTFNPY